MRSPPQKSFESEPTVSTGAAASKAAIGAGGRPESERSASVLSSRIGIAHLARESGERRGGTPRASRRPVGFWNVGIR